MPERRRRIALVTDAIAPFHRGGKEVRYYELAQRLAVHADVDVYTMRWWTGDATHREGMVTYHSVSPFLPLYSGERRSIRQALVFAVCCLRLLTADVDVIEADHMPYFPLFALWLVAAVRRRRLVVTWHEVWGPAYWHAYLGPLGRLGWWCEKASMHLPDVIIAASPHTAERVRRHTRSRARVIVAPNGVDLDLIRAAPRADDGADVIVVGRLLPHKRVDLLLDALALLKDRGLMLSALVVGSGPQYEGLARRAAGHGLGDLVRFRSDVHGSEELYGLLKAARVAVFPSEREGFGIAVLEALACLTPVITTTSEDNLARHLVAQSPQGGIVCDPTAEALAEAIKAVLGSSGESTSASDTAWLEEYDWAAITDSVYAVLSS